MLIVKIIGGLGNQMFQYAYAKKLIHKGYDVKLDISAFETYTLHGGYQLDKYHINLEIANADEISFFCKKDILTKILNKIKKDNIIKEKSLMFNKNLLRPADNKYIFGYFQCEQYFSDIRDIIIDSYTIKDSLSVYTINIEKIILKQNYSCSLHIRRGDYISDTKSNIIHGTCSLDYYKKAISMMNDQSQDMKYFIFSDDIIWVKENLKINNAMYIESKEKRVPHEDIYLMSVCKHNIIANSSFSWWGAWLNQNQNKLVIAPKRWFANDEMETQSRDVICENWIKI